MAMEPRGSGAELAAQLQEMGDRLAGLVESALAGGSLEEEGVRLVLQEMATAIEELRVAEEELTVQAEQLAASQVAIDAERERYVRLFEFAPDAYLETDPAGKILEANTAAEHLLGVPVRYLVGKLVQSFVAPHDVRPVRLGLAELANGGEPLTLEAEFRPRDLPSAAVEMRVASHLEPVGDGGAELRVRWLIRDVTERLKLDRELQQLHADVELLAALGDVNRLVAEDQDPVDPMLAGLVELAVRACDGADAGISILDKQGRVAARAVSGPVATELCDLQLTSAGPAVAVLSDRTPRVDYVADLGEWPALVEAMARHGVEWIVSYPIVPVDGGEVGVFNLYGRGSTAEVERSIQLLAEHAAGIISNGLLYSSATELARQLGKALESRGVIEQAKGVLMAWQGCDPDTAFDILRRVSQRENRKLRVIAEELVQRAMRGGGASPPAAPGARLKPRGPSAEA